MHSPRQLGRLCFLQSRRLDQLAPLLPRMSLRVQHCAIDLCRRLHPQLQSRRVSPPPSNAAPTAVSPLASAPPDRIRWLRAELVRPYPITSPDPFRHGPAPPGSTWGEDQVDAVLQLLTAVEAPAMPIDLDLSTSTSIGQASILSSFHA